jgi:hypothetical protein
MMLKQNGIFHLPLAKANGNGFGLVIIGLKSNLLQLHISQVKNGNRFLNE